MTDAHDMLLLAHVAAGSLGLVLGPLAILAERRPPLRSRAGRLYAGSALAVCVTALGLVATDPAGLWWLAPLALLTGGLAVAARLAPAWGGRQWVRAYAHGQGGSYVALVTAALVVPLDGPASVAAWIAPTALGLPLIERRVRAISQHSQQSSSGDRSGGYGGRPVAGREGARHPVGRAGFGVTRE